MTNTRRLSPSTRQLCFHRRRLTPAVSPGSCVQLSSKKYRSPSSVPPASC